MLTEEEENVPVCLGGGSVGGWGSGSGTDVGLLS